MKLKKHPLLSVALGICVTFWGTITVRGNALNWSPDTNALIGNKIYELEFVHDFPDHIAQEKEDIERYIQHIKLACGAYGIEVLTLPDWLEKRVVPDVKLRVRITDILPLDQRYYPMFYIYTVTIYVEDFVRLTNKSKSFRAITWAYNWTSLSSYSSLSGDIWDCLDRGLNGFIKDYLKANSEQSNPEQESQNAGENRKLARKNFPKEYIVYLSFAFEYIKYLFFAFVLVMVILKLKHLFLRGNKK